MLIAIIAFAAWCLCITAIMTFLSINKVANDAQ
jgi:hypothetical protein